MNAVELDSVSRTFGVEETSVPALRNVSLAVRKGEFVAVMGPSGSGKSTLLSIMGGLDTGFSGEVRVAGQRLSGMKREELARLRRRSLGFVFQHFNLVPTLTALENISLPLELDGMSVRQSRELAAVALERVGLPVLADRFIHQMSGGQRQRVAIARAVVGDRRLLLADEPTGALDSATGDEVLGLLRDLADDGAAVVLVTHEARHASWADRVVFLRDGRVVDEAHSQSDPEVLLARHA